MNDMPNPAPFARALADAADAVVQERGPVFSGIKLVLTRFGGLSAEVLLGLRA